MAPPADNAVYALNRYKTDPNRNLFCLDWDESQDDLELYGYWTDRSKFQRFEFSMNPCNYLHVKNGWDGDTVHPDCVEDLQKQEEYLGNM